MEAGNRRLAMPNFDGLNEVLGWIPLLCFGGASLVCFTHLRLTRRMPLLLIGFLGLSLESLYSRILNFLARQEIFSPAIIVIHAEIAFILRLAALILTVIALAMVFADLSKRVESGE